MSALDAINSIVIADDSLAVEIHAKKKFGIAPKMVATIFPLNAASSNRRMPT
jgi:Holliday junction resolvase RusA-like endonuclease